MKPTPFKSERYLTKVKFVDRPNQYEAKTQEVESCHEVTRIAEWLYKNKALPDNNVSSVQFDSLVQLVHDIGDDINIVSEQQLSRFLFTNGNLIQFKYEEIQDSHQASSIVRQEKLKASQNPLDNVRKRLRF